MRKVATTNPLHDKLREWTLPYEPPRIWAVARGSLEDE